MVIKNQNNKGEHNTSLEWIAEQIVKNCGLYKTLNLAFGDEKISFLLFQHGIDAHYLDVASLNLDGELVKGQHAGKLFSLPFNDESFETTVAVNSLEYLTPESLVVALEEIFRVTKRNVFLAVQLNNNIAQGISSDIKDRSWWETKCLEANFRKHPRYYLLNDYESLNSDGSQIFILLEKMPVAALDQYPLISLNEERGLHMDMTRDTGERSDAHIIRYQLASKYIKPGDRVLDAACGLGYGSYVVSNLASPEIVVGIDGSSFAIEYAKSAFLFRNNQISYLQGMLPESLSEYPNGSFDVIISFETLEHVVDPQKLLKEFYRLLTPGGRIIVSVPNDWSDETGEDPNPFHLHVYDWVKLKREVSADFIIEDAYAQTASQCKNSSRYGEWERRSRSLNQVAITEVSPQDCEWWLMTAMKSPIDEKLPYNERVFSNIATSYHPSICYQEFFENPWLMHSMVNSGYRIKNPTALIKLAEEVIDLMASTSNDYAAALCVKAYMICDRVSNSRVEAETILAKIEEFTNTPHNNLMGLRWKVSLLFVKGRLLQALGCLDLAKNAFIACTNIDVREFGIHLATKTTEAFYLAGKIAYALGKNECARLQWGRAIEYGNVLLNVSLNDVLIRPDFPNRFNHGDGIREYTVAWDNIARCANGLNLLNRGGYLDFSDLDNCLQTEYVGVTKDLIRIRETLVARTELLEKSDKDLSERTCELVETRQNLVSRTALLESYNKDLEDRTRDLEETRQVLVERSKLLEKSNEDLKERTQELEETRQILLERSKLLEKSNEDLKERTQELEETRQILVERSGLLEKSNEDLEERTKELVDTRQTLVERTVLLEQAIENLDKRTLELIDTQQILAERTTHLDQVEKSFLELSAELKQIKPLLFNRLLFRRHK